MSLAAKIGVVLIALLLAFGIWVWWINRPIRPVVLSPQETAVVEAKLEDAQNPGYQKGSREIILTERELNGLLNRNTSLGGSLRFELADGAVHARAEADLDPDLPVVGGRHLKARARFFVSGPPGPPSLVLDDLTVWGISLPNEWLAGLKGRNLFEDLLGADGGRLPGVEKIKVEPGRLVILLAE